MSSCFVCFLLDMGLVAASRLTFLPDDKVLRPEKF